MADYARPETLAEAFRGIERLLLISSSEIGQRVAQHETVIAAAKAAGIGRLVYTSLLHADTSPLRPRRGAPRHGGRHRGLGPVGDDPAERLVHGELHLLDPRRARRRRVPRQRGDGRIASAARADFAEAAALVLTGDGHDGRTYELAGDEAYTLADLAAELSRQTGRDIPYRDLPQADYAALLKASACRTSWPIPRRVGCGRRARRPVRRGPPTLDAHRPPDDAALRQHRRRARVRLAHRIMPSPDDPCG